MHRRQATTDRRRRQRRARSRKHRRGSWKSAAAGRRSPRRRSGQGADRPRPWARSNRGEKPWESESAGTLPAADRRVKAEVGGRATTGRAGKTGDDPTPPSDGQGIREREIILHRSIGPLRNLVDREAVGRLSPGVRSPSDRRGSVGARRDRGAEVIEDLSNHGRLLVCRLPVAAATQTGVGTGRFDHGFVASSAERRGPASSRRAADRAADPPRRPGGSGGPRTGGFPAALAPPPRRPPPRRSPGGPAASDSRGFDSNTIRKRVWSSRGHRGCGRLSRRGSPGDRRPGFVANSAERKLA